MAPPPAPKPPGPSATAAVNALCILVLLGVSIATYAYEGTLLPLYGSAPTAYHLNKVVWSACILGTLTPTLPIWPSILFGGVLLCAMPQTAYWAAVYTGRYGNPIWGPVLTHLGVIAPVMFLGTAVVKALQINQDTGGIFGAPVQAITLPVCQMSIMALQDLWPLISALRETPKNDIFVFLGCIAIAAWTVSPFLPALPGSDGPSPPGSRVRSTSSSQNRHYWSIAVLPLLPYVFQHMPSPTLPKPLLEPYTHPTALLKILSSVSSPYSGVVLVGEVLPPSAAAIESGEVKEPHSIRYLRAGHSLLGGVWIGNRVYRKDGRSPVSYDSHSTPLGDSIYSTFITQEAARLAQTSEGYTPQNALVIGLGTGIAASAFIQHNLSTTVVELDPAVYEAAKTYFGFAPREPKKVFISDARGWLLSNTRQEPTGWGGKPEERTPEETFDIVIHDCFSGGGVPAHMYAVSFWEELRKIIRPEGVVAVNFAGKLLSDSGRGVVVTLQKVFPQCRAFHDYNAQITEEKLHTDFINWVFFCTPSTKELVFRPATEADYLGSYLREHVLSSLPAHEVNLDIVTRGLDANQLRTYTLTDEKNRLEDWQNLDALHHWKVMREILPDVYWETY